MDLLVGQQEIDHFGFSHDDAWRARFRASCWINGADKPLNMIVTTIKSWPKSQ
jgi:hypothetical protein